MPRPTTPPRPAPAPRQDSVCDPNYTGACIPNVSYDLDCGEIDARRFTVVGSDVHRFDRDNDGIACES
ncbi:MAG: excalibur calcium-binding domain-containing protein [Roseiflexaceae bacterium]|nr:excalibur calcium-binding domain-containing protein [Roseiflexaceae bacterium]